MKVVVTGGTGFVGRALSKRRPQWTYLSSKDYDLIRPEACKKMYEELKPDAVIHLAGKVGGIYTNSVCPAEFYYQNTMMNTNIVHEAFKAGVPRVLASLSTCTFPDTVSIYPMSEEDILLGPPAPTNISYGYSKRSLLVQINAYREQYGVDYSTFCPSNIYGPGDNYDSTTSHFVPSLIRRYAAAANGDVLEFWGTGNELRQQLYVHDLAEIIPQLLEKHHSNIPLIVAPNENLSIKEMIDLLNRHVDKDVHVTFNNKLPGQFRKDGKNDKLLDLIGEYSFTSFFDGVEKTYTHFLNSVI